MPDKTKLQHFRNLVSMSIADGKIDESERKALIQIANQHNIPIDRLEVMLNHASEYAYVIPQNNHEKESQLEEMINLAQVDGKFVKEEYDLICTVAHKLGFSKEEVDRMIESHNGFTKLD